MHLGQLTVLGLSLCASRFMFNGPIHKSQIQFHPFFQPNKYSPHVAAYLSNSFAQTGPPAILFGLSPEMCFGIVPPRKYMCTFSNHSNHHHDSNGFENHYTNRNERNLWLKIWNQMDRTHSSHRRQPYFDTRWLHLQQSQTPLLYLDLRPFTSLHTGSECPADVESEDCTSTKSFYNLIQQAHHIIYVPLIYIVYYK